MSQFLELLPQLLVNGILIGGLYALVAVAFTLTIGMLNFLNFTIPALFMVASMVTWGFTERLGLPWPVAALIAIAITIVASLIVELFTYRFMKAKYGDATEHAIPLVSSLGFLIIAEHLIITIWGTDPQSFKSPISSTAFQIGPISVSLPKLLSLITALILVVAITTMLKRTQLGRALRSIAEKPDTSPLMGIPVKTIVPMVYLITGVLAAVAGILYNLTYQEVTPYVGDHVATYAIAGMVLGGLGSVWGAVAGGIAIGLLQVLAIAIFGSAIQQVPIWGVLLLILIVWPTGLFGHNAIGKGKF